MALTSLQARVESHRSASTSSVAAARDCRHRNHGATFHWAAGLPRLGLLPAAILLHNRASLESSICVSARDSGVISASGSSGDTAHEVPTLKKSKPRSATPANGGQQSPPTRSKRRSQTSDLSAGVIISRNSAKSARPGGAGQGTAQEGQTLAGRGADLQPNALPDSQVQDAAPQSPYQRKAAGKGKATAGSSPDAAPTPGQAQAPQQLVQQQHQTRAGSRLHAAARAAVEAGALDAADAPYLDFNTSPSPSAAHMARATAMPEWQVSILSCGTVSDLWRLYSKRTRDEDLSFAEIWLMIFQLREILDKQREQAANDAKQAAWKSKQKQKQASKAAGASGGAAGAVGVAGSGMVVPGEEEAKERARAVRMLQACAPALLWSSRAGPARCCLLVGAMTGAGYRGGDALKLLAEDSLNSLEEYSPQQVAEVVGGFARLGFVPGPGWSITLFQVTQPRLKTYSLSQLTLLAWGLAKWGSTPPANWLAAYFKRWRACTEALDKSAAEPDALEQSAAEADALADASLSLPLSAPAAMANASVKAGTGVGVLVERVLSQALWSWAELRLAPPHSVLRRMASEVLVCMPQMSMRGLASCAWALTIMNHRPPAHWLQELERQAGRRWPDCTTHGLEVSNLLWVMAAWQYRPAPSWLGEAMMQAARLLPSLDPRGLASLMISLSDLEHKPPLDWTSAALEQLHMRAVRDGAPADGSTLVSVLWAVSRFVQPDAALLEAQTAQEQAAQAAAARIAAAAVARVATAAASAPSAAPASASGGGAGGNSELMQAAAVAQALAAAGQPPPGALVGRPDRKWMLRYRPVLQDLCDLLQPQLAGLTPQQLLDVVVALADMTYYPGDAWMAAHEAAATPVVRKLSQTQQRLLARAYAQLDAVWEPYYVPRRGERY